MSWFDDNPIETVKSNSLSQCFPMPGVCNICPTTVILRSTGAIMAELYDDVCDYGKLKVLHKLISREFHAPLPKSN